MTAPIKVWTLFVVAGASMIASAHGAIKLDSKAESISAATKNGWLDAATETDILNVPPGAPGYLTEQWFTSSPSTGVMNENTRIRVYVDNETAASIDFMLLWGHGIGCPESAEKANLPWGTKRIGHEADGGIYNTYRIPFGSSIRVTAWTPVGGWYWYIGRGMRNVPLVVGEYELPSNTRLRLYKAENVTMEPLEYLTAAATPANTSGWLYQVTFGGSSSDFSYLEGCFRVEIDDKPIQYLSSGTEDFFLSASYFNAGIFHSDHSGLTCKQGPGTMSAYKFFEEDPVVFSSSMKLLWRNGEWAYHGQAPGACPVTAQQNAAPDYRLTRHNLTDSHTAALGYNQASITMYAWVYEYPAV
ncbi:uncharacterized protein LOC135815717 [Sycon ciliatum]|uniref:uncharacterized protein LOC135815717 n=1 Tax=Sycon ciliatum TaxID=27933 RepID=UPI0031F5F9E3